MNKAWNKVVAAAVITAGASIGYLYYKHQKEQNLSADEEGKEGPEDGADTQILSPRRHYINLSFCKNKFMGKDSETEMTECDPSVEEKESEKAAESTEEETETPAEESAAAEDDLVHFSSINE